MHISVVVATYCSPPDGLQRVIDSLDRQSLSQTDFESIFVDDGSTDDTPERLRQLAATRPNMRVIEIENSGWASRPRNVGIEAAQGDYVVFMDHDDSLFPEALERAHAYGVANSSDLVNGREVRSSGIAWAWDVYVADVPGGQGLKYPELVQPMLPHKFYRRDFLLQHGIRFPEGRRVLWEDNYFNLEVYARASVISVLASVPAYLWHVESGSGNSSKTFARDVDEYWQKLGDLYEFFESVLPTEEDLAWFRLRYFRIRVLNQWLGPTLLTRAAHRTQRALELIPDFVATYVPETLDERLPKVYQARASLVRSGQVELLRPLAEEDDGTSAKGQVASLSWDSDGRLVIGCSAAWRRSKGYHPLFREVNGRVQRVLPPLLADALPAEVLDVTGELTAATSDITYHLRGKGQPEIGVQSEGKAVPRPATGEAVDITHEVVGTLDLHSNTFGHRLADGIYDFSLRVDFMGMVAHSRLGSRDLVAPGLIDGRVAVAYSDRSDRLALQLGGQLDRVLDLTAPVAKRVSVTRHGLAGSEVRIPVRGLTVHGDARLPCALRLRSLSEEGVLHQLPAELVGSGAEAWVQARLRLWPGRYALEIIDPGTDRSWSTDLVVTVGRALRLTVRRAKNVELTSPWWGESLA